MEWNSRRGLYLLLCTVLLLLLPACGPVDAGDEAEDGQLNVVATTGQICDAVKNIGGDVIDLECLFGPGVDPHLYVPTEGDVNTLSEAEVIYYNGLHLEAQMVRVMDQMATRGKTVVAVAETLPPDQLLDWDATAPYDPHVWNDPMLWSQGVAAIRDTLVDADPEHAERYRENAEEYLAEIAETHEYVRELLEQIPEERRVMITAHDAFGYFARTYGLEVRGLQGISTESEASTSDVQELADLIVERQIPAIFVETTVSPRTIEAVQAAVEAQGYEVEIGGELFSDALGSPDTPAGTYTGMLRHNAETVAEALGE
ncbi:MAG: zinc ABC transporter substrate-binding protein [Chloroflexota bacterium]|nr:zinc ABC transporter substrate-binding protein [Chloroflexota bacterium]